MVGAPRCKFTNIRSFVNRTIKYFLSSIGVDIALGRKTGGRTVGTPNKRTLDVIERLDQLGCDPIEGMAKIALDPQTPIELRARMFSDLAQYVAPKCRAIDHSATEGTGEISIRWLPAQDSPYNN